MLLFGACKRKSTVVYSKSPLGYYYHLLTFNTDSLAYQPGSVALVELCFKTQSDSVFWDTYNNFNDRFYMSLDSSTETNFIKHYVSKCSVLDSASILLKPSDFFEQQFKTKEVPFFCKGDTVVKIDLKLKKVYTKNEFVKINNNLQAREREQIEAYFKSPQELELALDPAGFYWLERPSTTDHTPFLAGDKLVISYEGRFLNGRFLEKSPKNFEFIYGTPDQLLKGINYVIARLKLGQNAKIILPSRLAFGDIGSSNGTVPPYTPLVYEITITDIKK